MFGIGALLTRTGARGDTRRGWWTKLCDLRGLRRQRLRLGELDERMLADLGLTREEAEREAARAVWDVPRHWRA